jgi:hypothetical protein
MPEATIILNAAAIQRALTRIAHEIAERNESGAEVVLAGIPLVGDNWHSGSEKSCRKSGSFPFLSACSMSACTEMTWPIAQRLKFIRPSCLST